MLLYYLPLIFLAITPHIYLMLPTSISGVFPSPRPGPYKDIGYAFISSPAIAPFTRPSPRFKESGHPALSLQQIGYAVFYPAAPPKVHHGWFGSGYGAGVKGRVDWLASPKEEVVEGYKRFLGDKAYWVLGMSVARVLDGGESIGRRRVRWLMCSANYEDVDDAPAGMWRCLFRPQHRWQMDIDQYRYWKS
jgi:hypothetical protein